MCKKKHNFSFFECIFLLGSLKKFNYKVILTHIPYFPFQNDDNSTNTSFANYEMDASTDTDAYKLPIRTETPPPPEKEKSSLPLPKPRAPRPPPIRKVQTKPAPGGIDSAKIFGDFIADRLRQLSGLRRKLAENQLLRVVLEASEEEVTSGDSAIDNVEPFDDDDLAPLNETFPRTEDLSGTRVATAPETSAGIAGSYPDDPNEITDAYSYEENRGGNGQSFQDPVVGEPFPIILTESGDLPARVKTTAKRKKRTYQTKKKQRQRKTTAPEPDTDTIVPDDPMTDYSEIKIETGDAGGTLATWSSAYLDPTTSLQQLDFNEKAESLGAASQEYNAT